jgi:hypothetical protein
VPHSANSFLHGLTEKFGVQISATLLAGFRGFYCYAMSLGVRILSDAGNLPRHFHVWLVSSDGELVFVVKLPCHDGLGKVTPNAGQLVTEVAV